MHTVHAHVFQPLPHTGQAAELHSVDEKKHTVESDIGYFWINSAFWIVNYEKIVKFMSTVCCFQNILISVMVISMTVI